MSYEQRENSTEQGRPDELYLFTLGSKEWCYTSGDQDGNFADRLFKAVPIKNSGIHISGEAATDAFTIEASSTIGPAQLFMFVPPSQTIWVQIWRRHTGESEYLVSYQGEITQINYPIPGKCVITSEMLSATLQREGLRIPWSRTCPYAVYDPDTCRKAKIDEAVPCMVLSVDGNDVVCTEIDAFDAGKFTGGMVEWDDPLHGGHEIRLIELHDSSVLTIFSTSAGMYTGLIVTVYRGCRQTVESCKELSNYDNYGGFPHLPGKSPFDGDPVF